MRSVREAASRSPLMVATPTAAPAFPALPVVRYRWRYFRADRACCSVRGGNAPRQIVQTRALGGFISPHVGQRTGAGAAGGGLRLPRSLSQRLILTSLRMSDV